MLFPFHGGHIVEEALQYEESPTLLVGGGPAWVFHLQFTKEDLTPTESCLPLSWN